MILNLMASDETLTKHLKETNVFEEIKPIFNTDDLTGECVVISDSFLPYSELQNVNFNSKQTVFYMIQSQYDSGLEKSIKAICDSKDIILIPPRLNIEQIVKEITHIFNDTLTEQSNIITFFSSISNIGTTSTCLSVAKSLQDNTHAKIGVLSLNAWDQGTYQIDYQGEYLDNIKGKLHNQAIGSKEEFLSLFHMANKDSLYILGGNRYTKLERLYTKEEIQYIIRLSKQYFDVVLIDSGNHFDNALMVQALYESDMRFLVLNQQPKTIERFNYVYDEILYPLGYKRTDFLTIINRFIDKPQFPTPKSISGELDMLNISTIYDVEDPLFTELENKTLYDFEDDVYNSSIFNIVKSISSHASLELIEHETKTKKKRFFSLS